jgi:hypothetical protein
MPTRAERTVVFRNPPVPRQASVPQAPATCARRVVFDVEESDSEDDIQEIQDSGHVGTAQPNIVNDNNDQVSHYSYPLSCPPSCPPPNNPLLTTSTISKVYSHCRYLPSSSDHTPKFLHDKNYFKAVIDSSALHSMCSHKSLFESITMFPTHDRPMALMGDDATTLPIAGYGIMCYTIHGKSIRTPGYFVPLLGATLISVKQHIQYKGCMFHAKAQNTFLSYPTFDIYPTISNEIFVLVCPHTPSSNKPINFDSQTTASLQTTQLSKLGSPVATTTKLRLHPKSVDKYIQSSRKSTFFEETVLIQKLVPQATIPERATKGSIGYDVHALSNHQLQPGQILKIPTRLSMSLPNGMYLQIAPRSSLTLKGITVEGGV